MSNLVKVEHRKAGADQHVYIATPAHTIYANFHVSLLRNVLTLVDAGVSVTYAHLSGHPHVDDARNLLVADFIKSNATDLLFWDGDVGAQPDGALRLLKHDVDVVGGAYPLKDGSGKFPIKRKHPDAERRDGLLWVEAVPTGFLRIAQKAVLECYHSSVKMRCDGQTISAIFERGMVTDQRVGGDTNFCLKAKRAGFSIYCDPSLLFTHCGTVDFAGRLADHL